MGVGRKGSRNHGIPGTVTVIGTWLRRHPIWRSQLCGIPANVGSSSASRGTADTVTAIGMATPYREGIRVFPF